MNDPNQAQQNVDSDQVSTQDVTPAAQQAPAANETDAGTPIHDGLQTPKAPGDDEETPVATHNVFEQNQTTAADAGESNTDNVYPVDADDPASIQAALDEHHRNHGA